ncbi:MAG: endonuclease/exonuclease/phosphatase [Actinobacteria bacterium]|nr:endonuclease/exonuclease/phosphatase [Actinomycetota bacterium]
MRKLIKKVNKPEGEFMHGYYISWWNLENLFDTFDCPTRPAWLQKTLKNELKGWDQSVLNQKIGQLAKIICQTNNGAGPDLLGVCEVENKRVLDLLVDSLASLGRNYQIAHHDTSDQRGIDVAFIYDGNLFTSHEQFFYVVLKRTATRDIFQLNLKTMAGKTLIVIGNHWPSRRGGELESEPYRIMAAETLSYWHERILEKLGKNTPIVVMGDFNDEPFNRSMTEYALGTKSRTKVLKATSPRLLNLSWELLGDGLGTHYYNNFASVLDQFMISKGIAGGKSGFSLTQKHGWKHHVKIEIFSEMKSHGSYPSPIRFGRPSRKLDLNGFSDHYPVSIVVEEQTEKVK